MQENRVGCSYKRIFDKGQISCLDKVNRVNYNNVNPINFIREVSYERSINKRSRNGIHVLPP